MLKVISSAKTNKFGAKDSRFYSRVHEKSGTEQLLCPAGVDKNYSLTVSSFG